MALLELVDRPAKKSAATEGGEAQAEQTEQKAE
jgi:hypothetical protein